MDKIINFIKYNNAFPIMLAVILLAGGGALAATDAGQAAIGQETTRVEGVDNTLLLAADPEAMNFDFKIEKIEQDVDYYYVTYTLLNLVKTDNAWQYELQEKTRKVTKKIKQDLGAYLAEEFKQERDANVKDLKAEQVKAAAVGEQKREEVVEYTGLIGKTLDLAAAVFPGYEPVKKRELPSPDFSLSQPVAENLSGGLTGTPDNLTNIYNEYISANDPDHDDVFGTADNCPMIYNPDQKDTDADSVGDACDIDQMDSAGSPQVDGGAASSTASTTSVSGETATTPTDSSLAPPAETIQPDIVIVEEPTAEPVPAPSKPAPDPAATEPLGPPL